jgi:hypothetical protein
MVYSEREGEKRRELELRERLGAVKHHREIVDQFGTWEASSDELPSALPPKR